VNQELGEIGGVFVSKQPSDTDMGAKEPKTDWAYYGYYFWNMNQLICLKCISGSDPGIKTNLRHDI